MRDALDRGDHFVAGQRVLPRLQRGVPHLGFHQVHFAHAALILLEGGDALGIGRPQHDGPVAAGPARIVGGVAEVLDAVGGERCLLIGGGVAHPQVRVADEGGVLLVGREDFRRRASAAASTPAPSTASGGSRRAFLRDALRALHVALPAPAGLHGHGLSVGGELDFLEREVACGVMSGRWRLESAAASFDVVEGRRARAFDGIHQHELGALRCGDAVPEAVVGQPGGAYAGAQHQGRGVVAHEFLGARIVGGGEPLLGGSRGKGEQGRSETAGALFHLGG